MQFTENILGHTVTRDMASAQITNKNFYLRSFQSLTNGKISNIKMKRSYYGHFGHFSYKLGQTQPAFISLKLTMEISEEFV